MSGKRLVCLLLVLVLLAEFVAAQSFTESDEIATGEGEGGGGPRGDLYLKRINIVDAVDLYAYELNFSINSGSIIDVGQSFLGDSSVATYGYNERDGYLYAYGSRLDATRTGISGSGELMNITYDGSITFKGYTLIYGDGTTVYGPQATSSNVTIPGSSSSSTTTTTLINQTVNVTTNETIVVNRTLTYDEDSRIVVSPTEFNLNIVQGVESEREITLVYTGSESIEVRFDGDGDMTRALSFEDNTITLNPNEEQKIPFWVTVNQRGLRTGNLRIISGTRILKKVPIIANVRSEDFLFDVGLTIPAQFVNLLVGKNLMAEVSLAQVGPQLKTDVAANYEIKDMDGNSYYTSSETFSVLGEKRYSKEFPTENLKPGKYVLGLEIVYPGAFAVSSAQFVVHKSSVFDFGPNKIPILIGAGAIIVVGLGVIIWARRNRKKIGRKIRKK
jgi:hypothetical protein